MADLQISFPGVPAEAIAIELDSNTEYVDTNEKKLRDVLGHHHYFTYIQSIASGDVAMRWVMDANSAADHFIMANADLTIADSIGDVELLYAASAWATYTSVFHVTNPASFTRLGKSNRYILEEFTAVNEQFYELRLGNYPAASDRSYKIQGIHIGEWFTPATSLSSSSVAYLNEISPYFITSDQSLISTKIQDELLKFTVSWRGVTQAKIEDLEDKLKKDYNRFVYLYAPTDDVILGGQKLRYCKITDVRHEKIFAGWFVLSMTFEELER